MHSCIILNAIKCQCLQLVGELSSNRHLSYLLETLAFYGVENDATMHLCFRFEGYDNLVIGQLLSTNNPQAWQLTNDLASLVFDILRSNDHSTLKRGHHIIRMLKKFLLMTPMHNINEESSQHFHIFISSSVLEALVMLYMSPDKAKKHTAD
ncbi:hypothetical protein H5410_062048 [Solanum commersonii]|uniref:Uncharacterized protein n=1 Tax=Solanum commersonii TaxID=4109 RepID=A0A9J5W9N8_SOLCO|nr:hypothetical protein H5410_062048 [Solanum commersonii]